MNVYYYLLLTAALLALAAWGLRRAYRRAGPRLRPWLLPALAWRLLLTAAVAHWPSSDSLQANQQGALYAARLLARPTQALWQLQQARQYGTATGAGQEVYRWSQTLFFDKLVALLSVLSGSSFGLNSLYCSLLCFAGCWGLVQGLGRRLPAAAPAAAIAFLAWPTVLWWTAGLSKEAVLVGCATGLAALALPWLLAGRAGLAAWQVVGRLLGALLLAWVMTRVRYFFALPLLGAFVAVAGVRWATRRGWLGSRWPAQAGGLLLVLLAQLVVAKLLGRRLMEVEYFTSEVNLNYQHGLLASQGRPHLEYAHWQPTAGWLLAHAPLAAANTLVRPWLGEAARALYVGAGLENLLLVLLLAQAALRGLRGRRSALPLALALALALYCLLLAAFIGLSTPNLGTLSRYRAVLLPWLLWLCLAVNWRKKELVSERVSAG